MLNYTEAVAKLKAALAYGDESKLKAFIRELTSDQALSVQEKIDLLSISDLGDNPQSLAIFQAVRNKTANLTYQMGQTSEGLGNTSEAKKLYLVAAILGDKIAGKKLSRVDNQFPNLHLQIPFILRGDFQKLPPTFAALFGFAEMYFGVYDIEHFVYKNRDDESSDQLICQQDFLELLDKMHKGVFANLHLFVLHINITAKERNLKAITLPPFLTSIPPIGSKPAKSARNLQTYQDLREKLIVQARRYGFTTLQIVMNLFSNYVYRNRNRINLPSMVPGLDTFWDYLRGKHDTFLTSLPIFRKVADCAQIKYFTTTHAELWRMLNFPTLVPPQSKPYTQEERAVKISIDLPRTHFFSHQKTDLELFQQQWATDSSSFYLQGDAEGGAFGSFFISFLEINEIIPLTKGTNKRVSFGYLNNRGEVSGFNIAYTQCYAEQQAWFLTIMHKANSHPDDIKVHVLTNMLSEYLPGFENIPAFAPSLIPKFFEQFTRSDKVTHFLQSILSEAGEINLNFLDQFTSANGVPQNPDFCLDKCVIKEHGLNTRSS